MKYKKLYLQLLLLFYAINILIIFYNISFFKLAICILMFANNEINMVKNILNKKTFIINKPFIDIFIAIKFTL